MPKKTAETEPIYVTTVEQGKVHVVLVGTTPLILNRMSEKTQHELLMPKGKKTAAEKACNLKHDVFAEFRASAYTVKDGPTYLAVPGAAVKRAMASAALDLPGTKKTQIGRLTWVPGEYLPVYGTPQVFMKEVRSADMGHTPDIRTRVIVKDWVIPLSVDFVIPILNPTTIINLLNAAGLYIGIGDGRNEKGARSNGQFSVLSKTQAKDDTLVQKTLKHGREIQLAAMGNPTPFNDQTSELLEYYNQQLKIRGKNAAAAAA